MVRIKPLDTLAPDKGAKAWIHKFARQNHWRVASWMDLDDLIQEGLIAYYETRKRYPEATEPSHIQSLLFRVFRSKIENMVRDKTKQQDAPFSDIFTEDTTQVLDALYYENVSPESRMLFIKMPKEIQSLLALFEDKKSCEALRAPLQRNQDGKWETLNERFCKLLGWDPNVIDVVTMTRLHFQS